jgi:hypothetical protein
MDIENFRITPQIQSLTVKDEGPIKEAEVTFKKGLNNNLRSQYERENHNNKGHRKENEQLFPESRR